MALVRWGPWLANGIDPGCAPGPARGRGLAEAELTSAFAAFRVSEFRVATPIVRQCALAQQDLVQLLPPGRHPGALGVGELYGKLAWVPDHLQVKSCP